MVKVLSFRVRLEMCAGVILAACGGGSGGGTNHPPNGTITSPATDVSIGTGASVNFQAACTDPDGDSVTHLWSLGSGQTRTEQNPGNVVFPDPGVFVVTYTCTDSKGLADPTPDTRTITVTRPMP